MKRAEKRPSPILLISFLYLLRQFVEYVYIYLGSTWPLPGLAFLYRSGGYWKSRSAILLYLFGPKRKTEKKDKIDRINLGPQRQLRRERFRRLHLFPSLNERNSSIWTLSGRKIGFAHHFTWLTAVGRKMALKLCPYYFHILYRIEKRFRFCVIAIFTQIYDVPSPVSSPRRVDPYFLVTVPFFLALIWFLWPIFVIALREATNGSGY